jgi:long-chain-fatty-acid--[acyl-carrier-protein] ligase
MWLRSAARLLAKAVLALRYRIRVQGTEVLRTLQGPVLILPNHPAYSDPVIALTALWPWFHPRPVLYEEYFRHPLLYPVAKLLQAIRVPDLERPSVQARERTEQAVAEVIAGLGRGENFILWPAGRIQRDGVERLGAARAAADILRAVPNVQVVLVRTRGLWGSRFSFAFTGGRPPLIKGLWQALGLLLGNFLFFMPRRKVNLQVEPVARGNLPEPQREALNPWLEAWYNADGPEAPSFVPYHFLFGRRTYEFPTTTHLADIDLSRVHPETRTAVAHIVEQRLGRPLRDEEQQPSTTFDRLGLDSLDRMEVTLAVEQQFGFHGDQAPMSLGQLWALAEGLVERQAPKPAPPSWFRPLGDEVEATVLGNTIAEAFVTRALANRRDVALADDLSGALTYERVLVGALALSRHFTALPGANVGLLLPASVAGDVAFLALHLAGKLPVLLNWTTGPANLAHAAQLMGLSEVVTSRPFIDRTGVSVEGVRYLFLEDLHRQTGRFALLQTLLTVRLLPNRVRGRMPKVAADQPAVVLFTSGSERAPKAVPLTHANLVSELQNGIPFLGLTRRDSILGFLPAFHSFGIAATSLLPLLGGLRVVHHPDPTDASGLACKIASYKPTLLVGTPTFVRHIVERAQPGELASLRMIVVGAEKCPPTLLDICARAAPEAALLEGYGITECSPVVAVNRMESNRPGSVGQPLPGVEVRAVDLATEADLPRNQMGMLWVAGPTVFPGYIGHDGPQPFRERQSKRWYVTGDVARIDDENFIYLEGRLKRFLKAGGEMISLPALEEPLARRFPPTDKGPRVAVEGVETDRGPRIVLFSTEPVTLAEANSLLLQEGFRGVLRLGEVRRLEQIPVLGTGKVDYKVLRAQLEADGAHR